jgi:hypothetical protein
MMEVTLEKGSTRRLTKKFKYENTTPDKETRFQPQLDTASTFWKIGW